MEQSKIDIKDALRKLPQKMATIVWLYDGVRIYDKLEDFLSKGTDLDKRLDHIRVFDHNQEYHYWRNRGGGFDYRHRKDDPLNSDGYREETVQLNGTQKGYETTTVRHYMAEDFSGFIDSRYVKLN